MRYAKTFVAVFAVALAVATAVTPPALVQDTDTSAIRYRDGTTVYEFDSQGRLIRI